MIEIFIFLFGLAVGSFLNCLIYRLEKNESFLGGRSFCPNCKHILSFSDLIPLFSFFVLRGKCRYCQEKISWQYPLVEIATGSLFWSISNFQFPISNFQNFLFSLFYFLIFSFLIIIFVYDLKHYIIPDRVIYPAIGITFIYQLFRNWKLGIRNLQFLLNPLISSLFAGLFFLAIVLVSRGRWMGVGDIKLAILMGLFLGWPNILVALFFSFLIGAIIGTGLIILGKKTLKSEVPFGPFLVTGTFISLFWGEMIIEWYLHLFIFS
jgi:prepilin signal peptidase PulO-like enzyme (type II secretory pathway)